MPASSYRKCPACSLCDGQPGLPATLTPVQTAICLSARYDRNQPELPSCDHRCDPAARKHPTQKVASPLPLPQRTSAQVGPPSWTWRELTRTGPIYSKSSLSCTNASIKSDRAEYGRRSHIVRRSQEASDAGGSSRDCHQVRSRKLNGSAKGGASHGQADDGEGASGGGGGDQAKRPTAEVFKSGAISLMAMNVLVVCRKVSIEKLIPIVEGCPVISLLICLKSIPCSGGGRLQFRQSLGPFRIA